MTDNYRGICHLGLADAGIDGVCREKQKRMTSRAPEETLAGHVTGVATSSTSAPSPHHPPVCPTPNRKWQPKNAGNEAGRAVWNQEPSFDTIFPRRQPRASLFVA